MSVELQKIDCNCNDCKFMVRDFDKFNKWKEWRRSQQLNDFEIRKSKAICDAELLENEDGRRSELKKANKMTFQFDSSGLIGYGDCLKFNKPVSFIPNTCQLETQECFEHRRS